eukprot:jgi/Mesvir1/28872/Mv17968-RA.1
MSTVRCVLFGCGGVGRALLKQIVASRVVHSTREQVHVAVMMVCDSLHGVRSNDARGLADNVLSEISVLKSSGATLESLAANATMKVTRLPEAPQDVLSLVESLDAVDGARKGPCVLVDCTATEKMGPLLEAAASRGMGVVIANKKPVTASLEIFDQLSRLGRRFGYESTVGAGTPIIACLGRLLAANDPIKSISGACSGTLGFVMTGLGQGKKFSEVVTQAKANGYTEPDPRDDLGGMDVARKALIMARTLGWRLNMDDVKVESLFPPEMSSSKMSVGEFMAALPSLDSAFSDRVAKASEQQQVLRYTATVVDGKCTVGLTAVPKESPLGRLQGTDNLVEIYTDCYKSAPLVIQGAGAGNEITAAGVLADLMQVHACSASAKL